MADEGMPLGIIPLGKTNYLAHSLGINNWRIGVKALADPDKKAQLWKIRDAAANVFSHSDGGAKPLPIIEDGVVPLEHFEEFLWGIYELFESLHLPVSVWGHAGDANLHVSPLLDLSQVGDRQKVFKLLEDYYSMIMRLGGSTTGEHGDGRLRAPYLEKLYGPEMYELFKQVKKIFDPYYTLNPGVKMGVTIDDIKPLIRQEYGLGHLYDHMPRS